MKIFNNLTHTKFGKSILILIGFLFIEELFLCWGISIFEDWFDVNWHTLGLLGFNIYHVTFSVVYYILWIYLLVKCCLYYKTTKEKIYFSQMLGIVIFMLFVICGMGRMAVCWKYGVCSRYFHLMLIYGISEVIIDLLGLFLFRLSLFVPKWIQNVPEPANPWQGFCVGLKNSCKLKVDPNASRMEYWSFTVINTLFVFITIVLINLIPSLFESVFDRFVVFVVPYSLFFESVFHQFFLRVPRSLLFIILPAVYMLFSIYAQLRLMLRRLHDVGVSGWLVVAEFVSSFLAGFCLGYSLTRGISTSFVILGYIAYSVAGLVNLAIFILCLMPSAHKEATGSSESKKKASNIDQLEKLAKLRDMGALTQKEFEMKKKILLGIDKS